MFKNIFAIVLVLVFAFVSNCNDHEFLLNNGFGGSTGFSRFGGSTGFGRIGGFNRVGGLGGIHRGGFNRIGGIGGFNRIGGIGGSRFYWYHKCQYIYILICIIYALTISS